MPKEKQPGHNSKNGETPSPSSPQNTLIELSFPDESEERARRIESARKAIDKALKLPFIKRVASQVLKPPKGPFREGEEALGDGRRAKVRLSDNHLGREIYVSIGLNGSNGHMNGEEDSSFLDLSERYGILSGRDEGGLFDGSSARAERFLDGLSMQVEKMQVEKDLQPIPLTAGVEVTVGQVS